MQRMYVPRFNALDDEAQARQLVAAVGSAQLVTTGPDGYPDATLLPVVWEQDRVITHVARANPHWRSLGDGDPALAVITGPEAYISPAWYASKAQHGRVVPTWNYSAVHLRGRLRIHHDPDWLLEAVTRLTDQHEQARTRPWKVTDAPERYLHGQLRAIVGIELTVEQVEAKAKWSQNRDDADHAGVIAGIRDEGPPSAQPVADAMNAMRPH